MTIATKFQYSRQLRLLEQIRCNFNIADNCAYWVRPGVTWVDCTHLYLPEFVKSTHSYRRHKSATNMQ